MPAEVKKEIELEIAHVLFLDIVGYSRLSVNEQHGRVDELNGIVRLSEQYQKAEAANRILKIPTGDGMALVFYKSPEEPAQCAFEISRALKDNQRLQVRMGIHSGPVSGVVDVNERTNVAGAGINLAQRVMDCGDAGHILLSRHVAEDLAEYERWRLFLHDIGSFEVKHGMRVSVTNLYSDEVGNPQLPKKLEAVRNITPMCVGRQWRSGCWWSPRSPLGFSLFCAKDRRVRSPLPWKRASRCFRSKI
jgi:class 3 adenylate cyclase